MSYIVHGGPLFWPVIGAAAVLAALLGRFTYTHWHHGPLLPAEWAAGHGRHAAPQTTGGGVSPRAAAGSAPGEQMRVPRRAFAGKTGSRGVAPHPAAGSGVPGGGDAGDFPAGRYDDEPADAQWADTLHGWNQEDRGRSGMPLTAPLADMLGVTKGMGLAGQLGTVQPWEPAPQPVVVEPAMTPLPEDERQPDYGWLAHQAGAR